MKFKLSLLVLLLWSGLTFSQGLPLEVKGDTFITVKKVPFLITAPKGADFYTWDAPPGVEVFRQGDTLHVTQAKEGKYTFSVSAITLNIDWDAKQKTVVQKSGQIEVVVGKFIPPDPDPKPDPEPKPKPDPDVPPPIPEPGFRVLIIEEAQERNKLPVSQLTAMWSPELKKYLNENTTKMKDGKTAAWLMTDKDSKEKVLPYWGKGFYDAMSRPRTSLPWIIISNGETGFEGPLPVTLEEILGLLNKYKK